MQYDASSAEEMRNSAMRAFYERQQSRRPAAVGNNPFAAAGMPPGRLAEVTEALQRTRPMASTAMDAALAHAMERAVAASAARQMARFLPGATEVPAG